MKSSCVAMTVLCASAVLFTACSKNNSSTPSTPTCSVSAGTPSATTFGPEGGSGTVAVTAGSGCAWTSVSNASFITIAQGATGSSSGTVQFTVAANSGADRTGTIVVAGTTITITQRAAVVNPVTLGAPTPQSPIGGATIDSARPTLVVTNAVATGGNAGTVTYRFEISDLSSFPNDPVRTFSVDGVAQGSGTTSGVVPRDLGPSVLWYWHARATNGTVTSEYSATETFRTPSPCSYSLTLTSFSAASGGDVGQVGVVTGSTCTWTAVSNASFITVTSGASGTGNGSVGFSVAANTSGSPRTGTLTIAGQTVTVTQGASGLVVGFKMIDNGRGPETVTECQIRSQTTLPSTCTLQSTSFPLGTSGITDYSWTVSYDAPFTKTFTQSGTSPTMSFSETCGQNPNTPTGQPIELRVTLTVTANTGEVVTVRSGSGSQPPLLLRMFTCGF